jgi:hypothetical protein
MHRQAALKPFIEYKLPSNEVLFQKAGAPYAAPISYAEYNAHCNVNMAHGIFYQPAHQKLVDELVNHPRLQGSFFSHRAKNFLNDPKNYFAVRYVNRVCGNALIASTFAKKGFPIGVYSSELIFKPYGEAETLSLEARAYDMGLCDRIRLNGKYYTVTLRALHTSDETRFAIHFPTDAEREALPLDSNIPRHKILTANAEFQKMIVDGKPGCYYVPTKDIHPGEFIAINYGSGYWQKRGEPCILVEEDKGYRIAYFNKVKKKYKLSDELIPKNVLPLLMNRQAVESPAERKGMQQAETISVPAQEVKPVPKPEKTLPVRVAQPASKQVSPKHIRTTIYVKPRGESQQRRVHAAAHSSATDSVSRPAAGIPFSQQKHALFRFAFSKNRVSPTQEQEPKVRLGLKTRVR